MRVLRYLVAASAWLVAGYASLWIAATTKVGPVVATIVGTHGVHEGDVVVLVAATCVASLVTVAALRPSTQP